MVKTWTVSKERKLKTFMTTFSLSMFYLADQAIGKLQLSKD